MRDLKLQVMRRADDLWYWRIINDQGFVVDKGRSAGYFFRRSAVRKGRKWVAFYQRTAAETWEDA